jgi:hypothetical protein
LKQNISKDYKDGAVTYYPHGLQPNMHNSCAVWSIPFHKYVQSNLFVLAMYCDTFSNINLFSFSFFMLLPNIKDCTSIAGADSGGGGAPGARPPLKLKKI